MRGTKCLSKTFLQSYPYSKEVRFVCHSVVCLSLFLPPTDASDF